MSVAQLPQSNIPSSSLHWTPSIDLAQTIENNILRELQEEVVVIDSMTGEEVHIGTLVDEASLAPLGFIYDTSNDVGKYHLAIVNLVIVPSHMTVMKRENVHFDGPVLTMPSLLPEIEKYENWSQIIAKSLHDGMKLAAENLKAAADSLGEWDAVMASRKAVESQEVALSAAMGDAAKQ
ncbi:hypothetical protein AWB81_04220 [Caballeronia arationis]|uniref:hypothetical protein n=1 Tax=Caballeronia arationis TaxID=1777142 RepID=UPI00074CABC7|nr:hypothetical protein [Caballeronia arationis]SAK83569.1 hypothetical protein AWB81_04220 [Caballeronia arationis]